MLVIESGIFFSVFWRNDIFVCLNLSLEYVLSVSLELQYSMVVLLRSDVVVFRMLSLLVRCLPSYRVFVGRQYSM